MFCQDTLKDTQVYEQRDKGYTAGAWPYHPPHPSGLQLPSARSRTAGTDSEPRRSTTFYMKTLANDMTSLQAGSLVPCQVSCGLQHLFEK